MKNIPFCDYKKLYLNHRENYLKIIDEVASNGGFIMQQAKKDFEKELSEFTGCNYAIGVGNCTDGLEIIWMLYPLSKIIGYKKSKILSDFFDKHLPNWMSFKFIIEAKKISK